MRTTRLIRAVLATAAASCPCSTASAQAFTSFATFRAATGVPGHLVTFDDLPHNTTLTTQYAGIDFGATARAWDAISFGGGGTAVSPRNVILNFGVDPIRLNFTPPARSMGVYNPSIFDRIRLRLLRADDSLIASLDMETGTVTFAGYISSEPIAKVEAAGIAGSSNFTIFLDNLEWSTTCRADIGVTGGVPGQDGVLDNNDFIVFIDQFFGVDPRADVGTTGGVPGSDGRYDNNDFVVYIDMFFAGC